MSGHLVRNLEVGSYLPIGLPQGDFLVPESTPVRPLFITAGSGVTPVMSMLRTWEIVGNMPDVVHIHYAPHRYDVIFGPEMEKLAEPTSIATATSRCSPVTSGDPRVRRRHFSAAQLDELCPDWKTAGSVGVRTAVVARRRGGTLQRGRTWRCAAHRALPCRPRRRPGRRRRRQRDFLTAGTSVAAEADATTPLLRVAEDAGLNPDHGCRMGICHTCDVPLVAGRVRDLRTSEVIDEPGRAVQICISGAAGDCEIDLTTTLKQKELQR